jgi:hypothetical protein
VTGNSLNYRTENLPCRDTNSVTFGFTLLRLLSEQGATYHVDMFLTSKTLNSYVIFGVFNAVEI